MFLGYWTGFWDLVKLLVTVLLLEIFTDLDMLRENSRKRYQRVYKIFMSWCSSKQFEELTEDAIFTYFEKLSQTYSSTTLWSYYSMLRSMLFTHHNINMERHTKLKAFLKAKSLGYKAKKFNVFTQEEVSKFITEASDETYLASKVSFKGQNNTNLKS